MVVGVAVGESDVTVDMVAASLGDEDGEGVDGVDRADRGTKDPKRYPQMVIKGNWTKSLRDRTRATLN